MTAPRVSVIILNWNGLSDTCACLEALRSVAYPNYETIVVDNHSEGDEAQVLKERFGETIRLIENDRNYGFAGGCNIGIRDALTRNPEYILLLNNDTIVDPSFMSTLVEAAESLPQAAALSPKICHYDRPRFIHSTGGRVNAWMGRAWQVGRDQPDNGHFERIEERDYADGACMLIRRSALERVGLLDEDYFAYWEETDWCDRARQAGWKCYYVPSARIWHKGAASFEGDSHKRFLFRRNAFLFLRKRRRPYHLATALLFHVFLYGPAYFIRHPTRIGRAAAEARALLWHASNHRR